MAKKTPPRVAEKQSLHKEINTIVGLKNKSAAEHKKLTSNIADYKSIKASKTSLPIAPYIAFNASCASVDISERNVR